MNRKVAGLAGTIAGLVLGATGDLFAQAPPPRTWGRFDRLWSRAAYAGDDTPTGQFAPAPPKLPADTGAPAIPPGPGMGPRQGGTPAPGAQGAPESPGLAPGPAPGAGTTAEGAPGMAPEASPFGPEAAGMGTGTPGLDAASAAGGATASGLGGALGGGGGGALVMLGDAPPMNIVSPMLVRAQQLNTTPLPPSVPNPTYPPLPNLPPIRGVGNGQTITTALVPSVRGFKVADNQSPAPQDRIYFYFDYFNNLNADLNRRIGSPLYNMNVYRYFFGFEKTFLDGQGSIQLKFPIDNLTAKSTVPGLGGSSASVGDLAAILKYAFLYDRDTGNLLSGGLLVQTPTGPNNFAGFPNINSPHSVGIQPFLGFVYNYGRLYFQGFSSIDVPMSRRGDVTIWFNDLGAGYYVYQSNEPGRLISLIAPTFEVHANTPMNHGDPFNFNDLIGTPQYTNLTFGVNVGILQRGLLSVGYVNPVTGPRPFAGELLAIFNVRF